MSETRGPFGAPFHMGPALRVLPAAAAIAVAAWLLAVPLGLPLLDTHATVHDTARALQIALMALCALTALPALAATRWRWPLLLLLAATAATLQADRLDMAWREAATYFGLFAVAAAVAQALSQPGPRALLRWAIVAATGLYALAVLGVALLAGAADAPLQHAELIFGYANRRHFNHVQTVAVLLCLLIAAGDDDPRLRRAAALAAAASLALLALTLGRATILAGTVGLLAAAWASRSTRLLRIAAACAVAGLVLYLAVFQLWPAVWGRAAAASADQAVGRLASDQSRAVLWAWALAAWREAPWTGIGPMHLAQRFNGMVAHPHNLPLQWLAEWGPVCLLLASALLARFVRRLWRAARGSAPAAGGLALMLAAAVDSLFSGNAVMPVSQVWIAVAAGWAWQALRQHEGVALPAMPTAPQPLQAALRWLAALALMAQPVALAVATAQDWPGLPERLEALAERFPGEQRSPRFWSHGWF